jgi:hypothetical protein
VIVHNKEWYKKLMEFRSLMYRQSFSSEEQVWIRLELLELLQIVDGLARKR